MKNVNKIMLFIILIGLLISCDEIGQFQNGMATIQDFSSNKYGYINENKDLVIEKKYDWAGDFNSSFAIVEVNGKRGAINRNGDIIIPLIHDNVKYLENNYFETTDNGKVGIYNSQNQEIIPNVALSIITIHNGKYFELKLNEDKNSVCIFNSQGKQMTEAKYSTVYSIVNNYAIMVDKNDYGYPRHYKIYDLENSNNNVNKLPNYSFVEILKSNNNYELFFKAYNSSECGIVDHLGNLVIPFGKYHNIFDYGDEMFSVSVEGMNSGYADKNGNLVIKPIFNFVDKFENGIAKVTLKEKKFYLDKKGNCVKDCPTQKWLDFHNISNFKINNSLYNQLIKKGLQESKQEEYSTSIRIFSKAIEENPLDYEAYHNRGLSYLITNQLDDAEKDFNKSIQYNPIYSDSYYLRGNVHQRKGNAYSAISDYEKAIELNPYNTDSYMKCAIIYGNQGNIQKSCQYMKKACELGNYDACSGYSKFCN